MELNKSTLILYPYSVIYSLTIHSIFNANMQVYIFLSAVVIGKCVKYGGAIMGFIIFVVFFDSTLQKLFYNLCKSDNP